MAVGRSWADLFAGRWQIPLALVAAAAMCAALYRLQPPKLPKDPDALFADVMALAQAGLHTDAADAAANLLEMQPPLPDWQKARLHNFLANLIYDRERQQKAHSDANLHALLDHHEQAIDLGYPEEARSFLRVGAARDWMGDVEAAIFNYERVLDLEPAPDERREALQRLVRLMRGQSDYERKRRQYLYSLLAEDTVAPTHLWWALRHAIGDALDEQDVVLARQLLDKFGDRLKGESYEAYHQFLQAWILVFEGEYDQAGPVMHWIEDWLDDAPLAGAQLDSYGSLPALNQWLLGRMELDDLRPQNALAAFEASLGLHPSPDLKIAAGVGRGLALSMLERHEAALAAFDAVMDGIDPNSAAARLGLPKLQSALTGLFERRFEAREYDTAVGYLELAARVLPPDADKRRLDVYQRLGHVLTEAAERGDGAQTPAAYRRAAGKYFELAAPLALHDGDRYRDLLAEAGEAYDAGGLKQSARRMLSKFVEVAGDDPRLARALLLLGQGHMLEGHYVEATEWYRRLVRDFPELEEAAWARVYMADCLAAQGAEHRPEAREMLETLLAGEYVGPEAHVYREAYLRLCGLLHAQEDYAEAIARLEAFGQLYPDDPAAERVTFMLAEAYRRSAMRLRDEPTAAAEQERVRRETTSRFQTAADLYERYLRMVDDRADSDERVARYERLALFNRGDCLFELDAPDALDQALTTYKQAAARYELEPAALTAQTQIANVHLRRGRVAEAGRAIERARWLLKNIPAAAFERRGEGMDHEQWDRYLAALTSSQLFQGARLGRR